MADSKFVVSDAGFRALTVETSKEAHAIGFRIVELAKRYVGVKSGRLRRKISYHVRKIPAGYEITAVADTHYALLHHEGTRPHIIRPESNRVMRFKSRGRVIFAQRVFHPGTRPNKFLVRAMREAVR